MASKRNWSLVGRVVMAAVSSAFCVLWVYVIYARPSYLVYYPLEWATTVPVTALMFAGAVISWLGVNSRRAWLGPAGGALVTTAACVVALVVSFHEVAVYRWQFRFQAIGLLAVALNAAVTANEQRKQALEARKPGSSLRSD